MEDRISKMGKRSPNDTTPPDRIIDWASEAVRAYITVFNKAPPTAPTPEDEAEEKYFDHSYFEGDEPVEDLKLNRWREPPQFPPSLPPKFGLPLLTDDVRKRTLRTEGFYFRKKYDELTAYGEVYNVGTPKEVYDIDAEQVDIDIHDWDWLDTIFVFPESDRSYNGDCPGALTAEGLRLMDTIPSTPTVEELDDIPIGGAVFWLMKRAHKARLERLRKEKEEQAA